MTKELKEGKIMIYDCQYKGDPASIVARLKCETDFLAKGETFSNSLTKICRILSEEGYGLIGAITNDLSKESGERIEFNHTIWMRTTEGLPSNYYLHHDNKKVAFVQLRANSHQEEAKKLAHDIAMHIVAFSPDYVSRANLIENGEEIDLEIPEGLLKNKPQKIIDKITAGKMAKYCQKHVLLDQPFAKDMSKTVSQVIDEFEKKYGTSVEVLGTLQMVI